MTEEQRKVLLPLREDIRKKFSYLTRARELGALPTVLVAIRRKIFEAQDILIAESVRLNFTSPRNWFAGK